MAKDSHKLELLREHYRLTVERGEATSRLHLTMAYALHTHERFRVALKCYDLAVELDPTDAQALSRRADLLSTCPDDYCRNGSRAIDDAERAVKIAIDAGEFSSEWSRLFYRRILAAAYAEAGDLRRASELLISDQATAVTQTAKRQIFELLETLAKGQPIRKPSGVGGLGIFQRRDA